MPTATVPDARCEECAQEVPADHLLTLLEGDRWCPDCVGENLVCHLCASPTRTTSLTVEEGRLCSDCLDGWTRCERCDLYTEDPVSIISGPEVCDDCTGNYERCDDCDGFAAYTYDVEGGNEVCNDCRNDSYRYCEDCTLLVPYQEDLCEDCTRNRDTEPVHRYDYRPTPLFHGEGPLYLGLELELYASQRDSGFTDAVDLAVAELGELGYLKEDGSISHGFEMVTHPMSWDYARTRFPWQLLNKLRLLGCRTDESVGIHVHVSRAGFDSPAHIYRWLKFVYRNESPITVLARRENSEWARFTEQARSDAREYAKGSRAGRGRYHAINVYPAHTFEMRMFASSLRPRQVKAALGFAAASVEYTRTLTAAQVARSRGWEWSAFCAWLSARPQFRDLYTELEELACAC
ncbi:hypothetical protein ACWEKT_26280 [Nocardia takedensis]